MTVPTAPPENIMAVQNGSCTIIQWKEPQGDLNGILRGYKLVCQSGDFPEVSTCNAGEVWFSTDPTLARCFLLHRKPFLTLTPFDATVAFSN